MSGTLPVVTGDNRILPVSLGELRPGSKMTGVSSHWRDVFGKTRPREAVWTPGPAQVRCCRTVVSQTEAREEGSGRALLWERPRESWRPSVHPG